MKISIYLFAILFLNGCIIQRLPTKSSGDGFSDLSAEDSLHLTKFNIANFNTTKNYNEVNKTFIFEEVETADLKTIISKNKLTMLYIWAPWCVHCWNNVPVCVNWFSKMSEQGLNLVLVSQYYDIKSLTKQLNDAAYKTQSYVLANSYYGSSESKKQEIAKKELEVTPDGRNSVPTQILFDQNGKVLYSHSGELRNKDTVLYYVNIYNK